MLKITFSGIETGIQISVQWRELCGRGEGEWESKDTRGVQVGVKNKERVYVGRK